MLLKEHLSDSQKNRFLDYLQILSDNFQKMVFIRSGLTDNKEFSQPFREHLKEEFGHDEASVVAKEMHINDVLDLCNNLDIDINQKLELVFTAKLNSIDSMFDFCIATLNRDELICQHTFLIITRIINTITDHPVIKDQTRALVQLVKQRQIKPLYPVLERWWSN